ncbi:glycine zipper 2TM domain-containing protein [uncultured Roseobacter sp.]|uniref:YMGG-like glycine zipper-containing protein n=1 Tax=uncultured Roseobacter sp. TaxID=114847 RepID=UPI00262F3ADD|nr:glycine zipper 2TM domain-containing protein [uncultured Roseobacter sp.]
MKKLAVCLSLVAVVSACATRDQNTVAGTVGGAALGAAIDDDNRSRGALIGAAAGALAGNYLGRTAGGDCVYQNPDGSRYTAACP